MDQPSSMDTFKLYFYDYWSRKLKTETNRYGLLYWGCELESNYLGRSVWICDLPHCLVYKTKLHDYRSTDSFLHSGFPSSIIMSRKKWFTILKYLHVNNNENDIRRGEVGHDPKFKIHPIIVSFILATSRAYSPRRVLTADEAICPWRGRDGNVAYMKAKTTVWNAN